MAGKQRVSDKQWRRRAIYWFVGLFVVVWAVPIVGSVLTGDARIWTRMWILAVGLTVMVGVGQFQYSRSVRLAKAKQRDSV